MRRLALYLSMLSLIAAAGVLVADPGDKPVRTGAAEAAPAKANNTQTGSAGNSGADSTADKAAAKSKNKQPLAITPEREAAVRSFVERNHPELSELLVHLKANQPKQYEQAVKEISRVTERLAQFQEKDPEHYDLEVKLWTAQSRVQLLAAKLKMGGSEVVKKDLHEALDAQVNARLDVLKHQREQAAERLDKMDREIEQVEANRQQTIDRQLETLARAAGGKNGGKGSAAKQAVKQAVKRAVEGKPLDDKPLDDKPPAKPTTTP